MRNSGNGFFAEDYSADPSTGFRTWFNDAEFAPFDQGTHLPDLYVARVRVGGGGRPAPPEPRRRIIQGFLELLPSVIDFSVSATVFDFDRDGDVDLVVGNSNPTVDRAGQNRLYINQRSSPPTAVSDGRAVPRATTLLQNYPNPFNASTVIRYSVAAGATVTLVAVNVLGSVVMRTDPGYRHPGTYEFRWDAGNLPGGVYFYSAAVGGTRSRPARRAPGQMIRPAA